MKASVFKVLSVSMAMLLLFSTVSWTVEKHLCMGRVMDTALFSHAEDCGMKAGLAALEDYSIEDNSCCGDEVLTIEGQDELTIDYNNFDFSQQVFVIALSPAYINLFQFTYDKGSIINTYPPPNVGVDLNILHQTFLI